MSKMSQWYPRYVGDYMKKTQGLSLAEHGAYALMMDHYYSTNQPLPASASVLHRICRAFAPDEQEAVQSVLRQFFVLDGDVWRHERIDQEIKKRENISASRSKAAHARHDASADASASVLHDTATATSTARSRKNKYIKPSPLPPEVAQLFEGKDFNDFRDALPACSALMGVPQLGIEDQQTLCGWLEKYDMNSLVMPTVAEQIISYKRKNQGQRPKSLAYFNPRLAERNELMELAK